MHSDDPVQQYERDGCVRVRGFFSAEALSGVRRELDRYEREVVPSLPEADRTLEADGKTVRESLADGPARPVLRPARARP